MVIPAKLNQKNLAKRLKNVTYNAIRLHRDGKAKETLEAWSAKKDPDGIAWKFLPHESTGWDNFYAPVEEGEEARSEGSGNLPPQVGLKEVRDRILSKLKLGTQSPKYREARKLLDQFIKEIYP